MDLLKSDYDNEPHTYGKCIRCFKNYSFPASWGITADIWAKEAPADTESSLSSGSVSDDSVDTCSEDEAVSFAKIEGLPTKPALPLESQGVQPAR